ncbi:DUF2982 domain-containing protein [Idiomarina aminovorans]|uniref:DUF2982 domain-containing protein n=1 Tax=Idiomarina aminovorans TaxID=2914829 RepID=UPI00200632A3|nr:DUF2982 domain-containing protein [Idiomarina sp. ATCH4]MCK7459090.1 DUF2982 domain-containing protein [Idiomarina sp. ATCH4]
MQFNVTPHAKRNALTFCGLAVLLFALLVFLHLIRDDIPVGLSVILGAASGILMLLGIGKIIEPPISLVITPEGIRYLHRRGQWNIRWENIIRYDVPRVNRLLELEDAPYLGFRLYHVEEVLNDISPRLASALLFEQRQLLTMALRHQAPDRQDYTAYFDIPDSYISPNGTVYKGLIGVFGKRMEQMRELLGYDLYVSESALDRDIYDFKAHLQKLQASRNEVA